MRVTTSTSSPRRTTQSTPRRFSPRGSLPPPSSPKKSSRSFKRAILSTLGFLVCFSIAFNIFFFRWGRTGRVGGIVNDMKKDAAWGPIRHGDDGSKRRMFRHEKLKRQDHERVHDGSNGSKTHNDQKHDEQNYDDDEVLEKNESRFKKRMNKGGARRRPSNRMKQNHSRQKLSLRRSFRSHPIRKKGQSSTSWSLSLPEPTNSIKFDRTILLDGIHDIFRENERASLKDWLIHESNDEMNHTSMDKHLADTSETVVWENEEECVPMFSWQTTLHPTCNSMHETDISLLVSGDAFSLVSAKGFWRNAWKVDSSHSPRKKLSKADKGSAMNKYTVLKSLKYVHEPNQEVFELSRVETIALDVLTKSRHTINIYGYCGSSSIQEFAGGDLKNLLPKLDPIDKLRMALSVANGVADIHGIDSFGSFSEIDTQNVTGADEGIIKTNRSEIPVSLIHNDINMDNVLLGYRDGIETPILNDFNIAVFRKKHAQTGEPCRFHGRFANPQWMSPEQQTRPDDKLSTKYLNEKIDIYALGNIFYKISVGKSPWKYNYKGIVNTPEIKAKIVKAKLQGAKPRLPPEVRDTTDPSLIAVLTAMDRCYRNDVELRPSARELATFLKMQLEQVENPDKVMGKISFK